MSGRLAGRVSLVTGASRGIGRATALGMAREGASVCVNYTASRKAAEEVVGAIEGAGGQAFAARADVSKRSEVEAMVREVAKRFGGLDILVNNAGIITRVDAMEMREEDFDRMMSVNVRGTMNCIIEAAKYMQEKRYGRIVNLASVAGIGTAAKNATPYAVTKGAVMILTKRLAQELGPDGITVNAVAPGYIETDMTSSIGKEKFERMKEEMAGKTALARIGRAEEVAEVVLFLASDEASFVSGQIITVDGGRRDFLSSSA